MVCFCLPGWGGLNPDLQQTLYPYQLKSLFTPRANSLKMLSPNCTTVSCLFDSAMVISHRVTWEAFLLPVLIFNHYCRLQHSLDRKKCAAKRVNNEMCWSVLDGLWASATLWQSCLVAAYNIHVSFSGPYWTWDESGFTLFDQWISMIVLQFFQSIMINIANSLYYESHRLICDPTENLTQKYLLQYGLSTRFIWNIKYDQM